ncbi:DUF594 family protein [Quillaja saponaria]|uniref:DUF594 family protein n=1 Tax=Quillaja saponaria TaxID=32244 RepID=A0AAD7LS96_QUISA|nr:DUF594 family protein [Quillaja saponaria]
MLVTIFSTLMMTKRRNLIQLKFFFDEWELRALVLLSITLQCIQVLFGNRRQFSTSMKLRFILWVAYLSSDTVATVSLSILSCNAGQHNDDSKHKTFVIMSFWAPLLVLHLGGSDTITAYSLEDNELWRRHLLGLPVQVLLATYVVIRAWVSVALNFLAIPLLVAGTIKSGVRILTLWNASRDRFRDSLFPPPNAGPNYARSMEEYESKKKEGFHVTLGNLIEDPIEGNTNFYPAEKKTNLTEADILHYANNFFSMFKPLFADLILSFHDVQYSQSFFRYRSYPEAFKVVEVELGFMYDLTYTKAFVVYSRKGVFLRIIELLSTISVLCVFRWVSKDSYWPTDVIITYALLSGALAIDIFSIIVLLFSDWTMLWLKKHKNNVVVDWLHSAISAIGRDRKRWSNTMGQYNLIKYCFEDRPSEFCTDNNKNKFLSGLLEKCRSLDREKVPDELKELIFEELQRRLTSAPSSDVNACKKFVAYRGDWVLEQEKCLDDLGWSIKVEFDRSILLWHIATELCYYSDRNKKSRPGLNWMSNRLLSRYTLYLLLEYPSMFPSGIGKLRFQDTCAEATEFFNARKLYKDEKDACQQLLGVCTDFSPSVVKGEICKSALFDACKLAQDLDKLETKEGWDSWKKWNLITHVWVEMLFYSASHCQWTDHAQQLRRGGELLTHVWLLMAHFGITEQVQEGHSRTRLVLK